MKSEYYIAKNHQDIVKLVKACKKTKYCCFDYETNAESLYNDSFVATLLSITFQPGSGIAIPLNHFETPVYCDKDYDWKRELIYFGRQVLEDPEIVKIAWNLKFDDQINKKFGIYLQGTLLDGMLCKYLLNEERPNGLKEMVELYLPEFGGYQKENNLDKLPWDKKPLEPLAKYGCMDTDCTFRLTMFFEKRLMDLDMYYILRNLYMPASRVLTDVEINGLYMDRNFNQELLKTYKPKIDKARETIYNLPVVKKFQKKYTKDRIQAYIESIERELDKLDPRDPKDSRKIKSREEKISRVIAGEYTTKTEQELTRQINLNSNTDLPRLMYSEEGLNLPIIKYTKDKHNRDTDKPSTDEETLTELRLKFEDPESTEAIFLDNLLELRALEKMYKVYILGWSEKVQDDSCLHGRFNLIGTTSNRLSSSEPNLQQVPKTSVDPNIKKQLVSRPGTLYLVMDFSQAELRMMAHLAKDETYLRAFAEGRDPHLAIAAQKYDIPYEEALIPYEDENHPDHKIWKIRRKQAKQIAFGLIYGIQKKLLAQKLSDVKSGLIVTPDEAEKMRNEFFEQHPSIERFMKKQERILKKQGYITSLFGTRRRLPQIFSRDEAEAAYAIRLAVNFPCLLPSSQALSKNKGWVNYEQLREGDEILTFNPNKGYTEWQKVTRVNVFDYKGDMVRLKTKHLDVLSTPDHRWYVSRPNLISNLSNLREMTSEQLYQSDKPWAIPIRAPFNNPNIKNKYSDEFVAFMGWWLTDGSLRRNQVKLFQSYIANPDKVNQIDDLINSLDIEATRKIHRTQVVWYITDKDFKDQVFKACKHTRRLNMEFISELTQPQLEILLETMRLGDGYKLFATGDKEQAELLQAIVVLVNNSSSMYELSHKGDKSYFKDPNKQNQTYVEAKKTSYGIKFSNYRKSVNTKNTYNSENNLSKIRYEGKVWCPTVPNGAFITRVIGEDKRYRTLITGNCQSPASNMTLFGSILNYWDMKQGKFPYMMEVATVHDAVYYNTDPKNINVWVVWKMWETFRNPQTKKYFGFQIDDVDMSMDFSIGRTMAEELPFIPGYDYSKMLEPNFSVEEYMEEAKQYKHLDIKDYPKHFKKEMDKIGKQYER